MPIGLRAQLLLLLTTHLWAAGERESPPLSAAELGRLVA